MIPNWNCWNFLATLPYFFFLLHMMNILRKVFYLEVTLFLKQAYCSPGRMRDKMLGHELVKVSYTMFSWTFDKTEHNKFAFLNSEDKAEGACTPVWQTDDRVLTKMGDHSE